MPAGIGPLAVAQNENFGATSRSNGSLAALLGLVHVETVENRDVAKALDLRAREFKPKKLSAIGTKLRRGLQPFRLIGPLLLARADYDGVWRHELLERFGISSEPSAPHELADLQQLLLIVLSRN